MVEKGVARSTLHDFSNMPIVTNGPSSNGMSSDCASSNTESSLGLSEKL